MEYKIGLIVLAMMVALASWYIFTGIKPLDALFMTAMVLAFFIIPILILATLYKVVRAKGYHRLKMALAALYSFGFAMYLDGENAWELVDKHGDLGGADPLMLGTWQVPAEISLLILNTYHPIHHHFACTS